MRGPLHAATRTAPSATAVLTTAVARAVTSAVTAARTRFATRRTSAVRPVPVLRGFHGQHTSHLWHVLCHSVLQLLRGHGDCHVFAVVFAVVVALKVTVVFAGGGRVVCLLRCFAVVVFTSLRC